MRAHPPRRPKVVTPVFTPPRIAEVKDVASKPTTPIAIKQA